MEIVRDHRHLIVESALSQTSELLSNPLNVLGKRDMYIPYLYKYTYIQRPL